MSPRPGRVLVMAGLLGALALLVDAGVVPLLAWTERCTPLDRYPVLFAGVFVTWLAARSMPGPRTRRAALLVGSLATAAVFDPGFAAASVLWITVLHRLLFGASPRRVAHATGFVAVTVLALGLACNRDLWPDVVATHPWLARWGYLFAVAYTFRLAWLLHQVRMQRTPSIPLPDLLTFFLFAPFFLIVPYMVAIPRCDRFCAGLDRHDPEVERSGLRLIALGLALSLVVAGLVEVYDPPAATRAAVATGAYGEALLHGLLWYPPFAILTATAIGAILVGLVRALGIDLAPSFDHPERARSITDWWRRWNLHFRELLVDLFYYPVVMKHRRRPVRATVLGCASVFLLGSVLFHLPKPYFRDGTLATVPVGTLAESLVMFGLVAAALVRDQRRPAPAPRHPLLGLVTTWLAVFVAVAVVGYGVQDLWNTHVASSLYQEPRLDFAHR